MGQSAVLGRLAMFYWGIEDLVVGIAVDSVTENCYKQRTVRRLGSQVRFGWSAMSWSGAFFVFSTIIHFVIGVGRLDENLAFLRCVKRF